MYVVIRWCTSTSVRQWREFAIPHSIFNFFILLAISQTCGVARKKKADCSKTLKNLQIQKIYKNIIKCMKHGLLHAPKQSASVR